MLSIILSKNSQDMTPIKDEGRTIVNCAEKGVDSLKLTKSYKIIRS